MGQDPHHDHNHAHGHDTPTYFGWAFGLATTLNFALVTAQVVYGLSANSIALLADAGNFGDGLGLVMAWGAHIMSRSRPTERYTYGLRAASIYSALINAIVLLVATGAIAWEAIKRFGQPEEVGVRTMMIVALGAIVANGLSAWLLMAGRKGDLNVRGAFAHMVADAGVSAGVVASLLHSRFEYRNSLPGRRRPSRNGLVGNGVHRQQVYQAGMVTA